MGENKNNNKVTLNVYLTSDVRCLEVMFIAESKLINTVSANKPIFVFSVTQY